MRSLGRAGLGTPSSGNPLQTTTVNDATGAISGFGSSSNSGSPRTGLLVARFPF